MSRSSIVGRWHENGKAILKARRRAGLSQERLAAAVGTTRRHMIRLENGEHLPSGALRNRIADVTGCDRDAITASDDDEEAALPADLDQALHILARYVSVRAAA